MSKKLLLIFKLIFDFCRQIIIALLSSSSTPRADILIYLLFLSNLEFLYIGKLYMV